MTAITTTSVAWTANFWIVLVAKAIEGLATTVFLPALTLLLFGVIKTKNEGEILYIVLCCGFGCVGVGVGVGVVIKQNNTYNVVVVFHFNSLLSFKVATFVRQTEVSNSIGNLLYTLSCGLMAFFCYPNISSIFYLLGIGGVIAAVLVLLIPSAAIDDNRARQLEEQGEELYNLSKSRNKESVGGTISLVDIVSLDQEQKYPHEENEELGKDDDEDWDRIVDIEGPKENETNTNTNSCFCQEDDDEIFVPMKGSVDEENKNESCDLDHSLNAKAASYRILLKNKNIAMFALLTFVYHLANAGMFPLVAQYLALGNEKSSMIFISAILLLFYFAQTITAQVMMKAVETVDHKTLLVLVHLILPIRCGLIAIMVTRWDNKYAICSTQLLDGVGAGIYDIMISVVVSKLTVETGRFGVTYGFIVICWRIGHGFSYLLAETI